MRAGRKVLLMAAAATLLGAPGGRSAGADRLQAALEQAARVPGRQLWAADADTGNLLASAPRGSPALGPRPPGSLLKVFLYLLAADRLPGCLSALASCGSSPAAVRALDACWDRRGHGNVGFREGLAYSCQRFASMLAARVEPEAARAFFRGLGLQVEPGARAGGKAVQEGARRRAAELTGHDGTIRAEPLALLAALVACVNGGYLYRLDGAKPVLVRHYLWRPEAVRAVREGLELAALAGTARVAGLKGCLAKTGTAPTLLPDGRVDPASTQGWAFACLAEGRPRVAILVHLDRGIGAQAAAVAGKALAIWRAAGDAK
ncbi:MAG: hypothetical protein HY303_09630 [Candidatus Wallbacteria bacterium]|nr:hypothetical protein [Candidatus Wallbacteria bacterium]